MRLHVMSDLHLDLMRPRTLADFWARLRDTDRSGADVLVLAGDIGSLREPWRDESGHPALLEVLYEFEELYSRVIYVTGNHEFWGTSITEGLAVVDRWASENLLPRTDLRPRDTLWFPETEDRLWVDYSRIRDAGWAIDSQHEQWKARNAVLPTDFVVTHHLPTQEAIADRWQGAHSNAYFCAYLEDWLETKPQEFLPRLWIHGHTHDPVDVQSRFGFHIYANPLGYEREGANPGFWDRLRVEVPDAVP